MIGRIARLRRSGACGFIRIPDGRDVFFHASDLDGMTFDDLADQLEVRFTLVPDTVSGPRAVEVRMGRLAAPSRRH